MIADIFARNLDDTQATQAAQAGGKGSTLARLRQAGFPVPAGFVVTTDAFRLAQTTTRDEEGICIPPSVVSQILLCYRELGGGPVAVRSSAVGEDGERRSFAGQYATVLNVEGEEALQAAVRQCWMSLSSPGAQSYRGDETSAMAVVVQRMASAARAGVAFTADPVNGNEDVILIEAVAGLGESLVSGQAIPHRYTVFKGRNAAPRTDGFLDGQTITAVAELARDVEIWAGAPQDIEWAQDVEGALHLLQARPITTLARGRVTLWTRDNVGEVLPEPVTPLTWSVLEPLYQQAFGGVLRRLGLGKIAPGLFGLHDGRVYFNQTLFQHVMAHFYPSKAGWRGYPRLLGAGLHVCWLLLELPGESRRLISDTHALPAPKMDAPAETLLNDVEAWRQREMQILEVHLAVTMMGTLLCQALEKLVGDQGAISMLTRFTGVRSARSGQALLDLARRVVSDDTLREIVLATSRNTWDQALIQHPAGAEILTALQGFLESYGHQATQEFELAEPRWRDDPAPVWAALQAQVRALITEPEPTPERSVAAQPRWPPARLLTRLVQTFSALREDLKETFVLAHGYLRQLYLALSETLAGSGILDRTEAVFFLTREEITAWVHTASLPQDIAERIEARRAEVERWRGRPAPFALEEYADGRLIPQARGSVLHGTPGTPMEGIAASPGVFVGPARVVYTPEEAAALEAGEVLIAPAVTPGWAPLLRAAGGLVTEIGGVLSHGAIIAREYGVPAVLNIPYATQLIHSGQRVMVDGTRGCVCLLEE